MSSEFIELTVRDHGAATTPYQITLNIDRIIAVSRHSNGLVYIETFRRSYVFEGEYEDIIAELA